MSGLVTKTTGMDTPRLLDVVALLSDVPTHGLVRGQVGTVVEPLDGACEVEFSDDEEITDELLILHHHVQ